MQSDVAGSNGMGPSGPDPLLYPDIAAAGSLQNALQAELDRSGPGVEVLPEPSPGWRYLAARVDDGQRHTTVVMGIQERVFVMQFWAQGVCMADGSIDDLAAVAGAVRMWQSGALVRQLNAAWPFVSFGGLAEAHERGEAAEYKWQQYYEDSRQTPQLAGLHSFIAVAIHEPRLRALLPFTSHGVLGFSRTVGYPFSGDCPWVVPLDDDRYLVKASDGRELGVADPAGSVALVLVELDEAT